MKRLHVVLLLIVLVIVTLVAIDATNSNYMYVKALFTRGEAAPGLVYLKN
jgi:hypothetical protein